MEVKIINAKEDGFQLKDLKGRTMVTGIKGNPESIYIKVDKKQLKKNIDISWKRGCSILFNVKTSSLRCVDANERCRILKPNVIEACQVYKESEDYAFIRGGIGGWV